MQRLRFQILALIVLAAPSLTSAQTHSMSIDTHIAKFLTTTYPCSDRILNHPVLKVEMLLGREINRIEIIPNIDVHSVGNGGALGETQEGMAVRVYTYRPNRSERLAVEIVGCKKFDKMVRERDESLEFLFSNE